MFQKYIFFRRNRKQPDNDAGRWMHTFPIGDPGPGTHSIEIDRAAGPGLPGGILHRTLRRPDTPTAPARFAFHSGHAIAGTAAGNGAPCQFEHSSIASRETEDHTKSRWIPVTAIVRESDRRLNL
jgi:hypothetical protein